MRFVGYIKNSQHVRVFHFGDHDPSGIDMSRDIEDRIRMFISAHVGDDKGRKHLRTRDDYFTITRVALNMDQVRKYSPPENPAKTTDSRFRSYEEQFGESSWELDALNPRVLAALVRTNIASVRDNDIWLDSVNVEAKQRAMLSVISSEWPDVEKRVTKAHQDELTEATENERADAMAAIQDEEEEEKEAEDES